MHASSDSLVNDIYLVEGYCILFILVISHTLHNMHLQMINSKTYSQIFFLTVFQLITEHIKTPPIKSVCGDNISCPTCGYSWQVWLAFCACSSCYILKKNVPKQKLTPCHKWSQASPALPWWTFFSWPVQWWALGKEAKKDLKKYLRISESMTQEIQTQKNQNLYHP